MRIPRHLSERQRLLAWVIALSTVVGFVSAGVAGGFLPPTKAEELRISTATTHVLIDLSDPSLVHRRALRPVVDTLVKRGELLGRVMVSPPVVDRIAEKLGVKPDQVGATARSTANVPLSLTEPASEQRANDILQSKRPYRLEVQARPRTPILDVYSLAPSTREAERLANQAVAGLRVYVNALAESQGFPPEDRVQLRQLGRARGGEVNPHSALVIALLTFVVAFALTCCASLGTLHLARRRRPVETPAEPHALPSVRNGPLRKPPPRSGRLRMLRAQAGSSGRDAEAADDNWPRTTRVLPWMIAAFIAIIWLTPFNQMQVGGGSAPVDLKLDRLMLPLVIATWAVALAAGGRAAPRLRLTWIHAAVGVFVAIAFLSVVLDAHHLNRILELDLAMKKLPLLVCYLSLFVIVASSVRPTEVRPFLKYTLVLGAICGLGLVWEYRFKQNLFYDLTAMLLPPFTVDDPAAGAVDSIGRVGVHGPAEPGVEAAGMLAMALPVALVALMYPRRWRDRVLYGLAACSLMAGTFATYRKTGLLAPVTVVLLLAYFRRRELLKLAPLALVLVVVVSALSPGAMGSTVAQFLRSDRTAVRTVSDRTSDYDAIRPDLWTNFAFGRGWGTYNHNSYRILDSEILHRTVETGVLGLLAFLIMGVAVVVTARATIASRDPTWAPLALVGAAAAACFMVISALYDSLSFPHATYVFLYMAGFVAVVVGRPTKREERKPERPHELRERPALSLPARTRLSHHPVGHSR
jgi:hypothetical protein